jgi:ribonuclease-3
MTRAQPASPRCRAASNREATGKSFVAEVSAEAPYEAAHGGSIEAQVKRDLAELEVALGHVFTCPELLVRALTHRSLAQENAIRDGRPAVGDNERLEFLGDAVLGLVVAEALYAAHPDWSEGELTRVRAKLVSRQHMAAVAAAVGLGSHLRLSRGEERGGLRQKGTILSNAMEAVIGALFVDGGLEPARAFVSRCVMGAAADLLAEELRTGDALGNYKSALQEHLQATRAGMPVYRVRSESGPDHHKKFVVEVRLKGAAEPGVALARGTGSTKKRAEQDAARRALEQMKSTGDGMAIGAGSGGEGEEQAAS